MLKKLAVIATAGALALCLSGCQAISFVAGLLPDVPAAGSHAGSAAPDDPPATHHHHGHKSHHKDHKAPAGKPLPGHNG